MVGLRLSVATFALVAIVSLAELVRPAAGGESTINVSSGDVEGFIEAIDILNALGGGSIHLEDGGTWNLTEAFDGGNGFPVITTEIQIISSFMNPPTISRDESAPAFRFFEVAQGGHLELGNIIVMGGEAPDPTLDPDHPGDGGAILVRPGGELRVIQSLLENNTASGCGGAIANLGTTSTLGAIIRGNAAGCGGGIASVGEGDTPTELRITYSDIVMNNAGFGGGVVLQDGVAIITQVLFQGNGATGSGGGLYTLQLNLPTFVDMENATFTGNTAATNGAAMQLNTTPADLNNNTISGNHLQFTPVSSFGVAPAPSGGIAITAAGEFEPVTVTNTILSGNTMDDADGDCSGGIVSEGHNLFGDVDACTVTGAQTGDVYDTDPGLAEAADNGGPTETMALLPGSPAIDAGDNATCEETDQRGYARPIDGDGDSEAVCDIGAFEAGGRIWGDNNCSGNADQVDVLALLLNDSGIPPDTGDCPAIGDATDVTIAAVHPWGDLNCSGAADVDDALALLAYLADAALPTPDGCPEIGSTVVIAAPS